MSLVKKASANTGTSETTIPQNSPENLISLFVILILLPEAASVLLLPNLQTRPRSWYGSLLNEHSNVAVIVERGENCWWVAAPLYIAPSPQALVERAIEGYSFGKQERGH